MAIKYYYEYSSIDFIYIGQERAYLDPEETRIAGTEVYSLPAFATFTKPPKTQENEVAIFDTSKQKWQKTPDYRGMYQVNEDMSPEEVINIGPLPEGYVPATQAQALKIEEDPLFYIIQNGELIVNPNYDEEKLAQAKEDKYNEALTKAKYFEQNGSVEYKNCVFEMSVSNQNNLRNTQEALEKSGQTETQWNDKNDEFVTLTVEDIQYIRLNLILGTIRDLWLIEYPAYLQQIQEATTVAEVEEIIINYGN